jgi:hypothetical protein
MGIPDAPPLFGRDVSSVGNATKAKRRSNLIERAVAIDPPKSLNPLRDLLYRGYY